MHFTKKHKKGPEKSQTNNTTAVNACAGAITALVKPEIPKDPRCKLSHITFIDHPKLGKQIRSYMAKGHSLCQPKPKVQTKAEAADPAQAPKSTQAPVKAP
uniref:60S ribosomal protein L29-like n=1 Tax=Arvicanthis niloticus TaxID=61156 RepID=UPI0014860D38|nr:60S ribosomal protein L29-like [Arvicanthis niloticus]